MIATGKMTLAVAVHAVAIIPTALLLSTLVAVILMTTVSLITASVIRPFSLSRTGMTTAAVRISAAARRDSSYLIAVHRRKSTAVRTAFVASPSG